MADDNLRQDMVDQVREEQQQRARAPRVHKAPVARDSTPVTRDAAPAVDADQRRPDATTDFAPVGTADSADAPKKRRRRRRTGGPRDGGEQASDAGV